MSLSGPGSCPLRVQTAINEAIKVDPVTKRGALVVAAAGNESVSGSFWPANCKNVLTVVATDAQGKRASFSNFGAGAGVAAPGIDILSTVNPGTTGPVSGSAYKALSGTSMAAAHVSGVASLMFAVRPELSPFQAKEIIESTATPFPRGSGGIVLGDCATGGCGAGLLHAAKALNGAKARVAAAWYGGLLAAMPDGQVRAWGKQNVGELGLIGIASVQTPTIVPGLADVVRVVNAGPVSFAVTSSGQTYAFGKGSYCKDVFLDPSKDGDCTMSKLHFSFRGDDRMASDTANKVAVPALNGLAQIAVAPSDDVGATVRMVALTTNGELLTWGYDWSLLGLGLAEGELRVVSYPTVIGLPPIRAFAVSTYATLAVDQGGNLWGWGWGGGGCPNTSDSLFGVGAPSHAATPIAVSWAADVIDIRIGSTGGYREDIAVVLKSDGSVWQYTCGGGTLTRVALDNVVAIAGGAAILSDGSVWGWDRTAPQNPTRWIASGALEFAGGAVRMGDGHLRYGAVNSGQSPTFAQSMFGTTGGFQGRLNLAEPGLKQTNLDVQVTSTPPSAAPGEAVLFQVTVTNLGPDAARNAEVTVGLDRDMTIESLAAGCSSSADGILCALGDMAAGASRAFDITARLAANPSTQSKMVVAYAKNDFYDYSLEGNSAGTMLDVAQTDGDVPLPAWALAALGVGLLGAVRRAERRAR